MGETYCGYMLSGGNPKSSKFSVSIYLNYLAESFYLYTIPIA